MAHLGESRVGDDNTGAKTGVRPLIFADATVLLLVAARAITVDADAAPDAQHIIACSRPRLLAAYERAAPATGYLPLTVQFVRLVSLWIASRHFLGCGRSNWRCGRNRSLSFCLFGFSQRSRLLSSCLFSFSKSSCSLNFSRCSCLCCLCTSVQVRLRLRLALRLDARAGQLSWLPHSRPFGSRLHPSIRRRRQCVELAKRIECTGEHELSFVIALFYHHPHMLLLGN